MGKDLFIAPNDFCSESTPHSSWFPSASVTSLRRQWGRDAQTRRASCPKPCFPVERQEKEGTWGGFLPLRKKPKWVQTFLRLRGRWQSDSDERQPSPCAPRSGCGETTGPKAGRGTQILLFELLGGLPQIRKPASVWEYVALLGRDGARARLLAPQALPQHEEDPEL